MMKKILFFTFFCFYLSLNAETINKVVVLVNNEPITQVDIIKVSTRFKVDESQAINNLIQQKIITLTCKKYGIKASQTDIDNQLTFIAQKNNLKNIEELSKTIKEQGGDISELKETIEFEISKQMLFSSIASNIKKPTEEEIKNYKIKNKTTDINDEEVANVIYENKAQLEIKEFLEKEQLKAKIKFIK